MGGILVWKDKMNTALWLYNESGLSVAQLCRALDVSANTYFGWMNDSPMHESNAERLRELELLVLSTGKDTPEERLKALLTKKEGEPDSPWVLFLHSRPRGEVIQYDVPVIERLGAVGESVKVYIDVDGVINSFHEGRKHTGWVGEWRAERVMGYWINWYTDLVDTLNELAKADDVEIVWLTTWQNNAAELLSPALGIEGENWRVLYHKDGEFLYSHSKDWWKLNAIKRDIAEHGPDKVIWIDDDISFDRSACEWIKEQSNVLAISPFTDYGMTKSDFDGIIEYINFK